MSTALKSIVAGALGSQLDDINRKPYMLIWGQYWWQYIWFCFLSVVNVLSTAFHITDLVRSNLRLIQPGVSFSYRKEQNQHRDYDMDK